VWLIEIETELQGDAERQAHDVCERLRRGHEVLRFPGASSYHPNWRATYLAPGDDRGGPQRAVRVSFLVVTPVRTQRAAIQHAQLALEIAFQDAGLPHGSLSVIDAAPPLVEEHQQA
jgi:hypothetical protein